MDVSRIDIKFVAGVNGSIEKPIPENGNAEREVGLGIKIID